MQGARAAAFDRFASREKGVLMLVRFVAWLGALVGSVIGVFARHFRPPTPQPPTRRDRRELVKKLKRRQKASAKEQNKRARSEWKHRGPWK